MNCSPKLDAAPGLRWRRRADGWVALWIARGDLIKRGYAPKSARLLLTTGELTEGEAKLIRSECAAMQKEMLDWAHGGVAGGKITFNGTLASLIDAFQRDPDSPYQELRYGHKYDVFLRLISKTVGDRQIIKIKGRDFKHWHEVYATPRTPGGPRLIGKAHYAMTMLRIVFGFGIKFEYDTANCTRLKAILSEYKFENTKPRTEALTAEQAIAICAEANARGFHSIALVQAMLFDTMLRPKDAIGQWVPVDQPGLSDIHGYGQKWILGADWRRLDGTILTHRLSKSLKGKNAIADPSAGKTKRFDLSLYPMVMEEIARIPIERRTGPMIIDERTGLPYRYATFLMRWRAIATAAGVPRTVQNRDSRAGAITEGVDAMGGNLEAVRHAAGHSRIETTQRYSRQADRQTAKVAQFRAAKRPGPK